MPRLESLAAELLAMIVENLSTSAISRLSQTNTVMRHKTLPYLYATVRFRVFHNQPKMTMRVAHFLRTILKDDREELVKYIKAIELRGYHKLPPSCAGLIRFVQPCPPNFWNTHLSVRDRAFLEGYFQQAQYPGRVDQIRESSMDAALAFIVSQASNLQRLVVKKKRAVRYPITASLVFCATSSPSHVAVNRLQKLQTLRITAASYAESYPSPNERRHDFQLVSLAKLAVFAPRGEVCWLDRCLQATPSLKQLEYRYGCLNKAINKFDGNALRLALNPVKGSLEVLKISLVDLINAHSSGFRRCEPRFWWLLHGVGPLREFHALKTVSIPLVVLKGSKDPQTFRISDIIPESIESLEIKDDFDNTSCYQFRDDGAAYRLLLNGLLDDWKQRMPRLRKLSVISRDAMDYWQFDEHEHWLIDLRNRFRLAAQDGLDASYWQSRGWFNLAMLIPPWTDGDSDVEYESSQSGSEWE